MGEREKYRDVRKVQIKIIIFASHSMITLMRANEFTNAYSKVFR